MMKKQFVLKLAVVFVITLTSFAAQAQKYSTYVAKGLKVTVPSKKWKVEKDGGYLSYLESPQGSVDLTFDYVAGKSFDKALDVSLQDLGSYVKKYKQMTKGDEETINGMPALTIEGEGWAEGVKVNVISTMVMHGSNVLIVHVVMNSTTNKRFTDITNRIIDSIRKG